MITPEHEKAQALVTFAMVAAWLDQIIRDGDLYAQMITRYAERSTALLAAAMGTEATST